MMLTVATQSFAFEPSANPVAEAERAKMLIDPGFGRVFTDHMAIVRYSEGKGWHDARITARQPLAMDPAASVLHYAQEIFEGMKAYRRPNGGAALFRPEANARRFQASARRMAMVELPEEIFLDSIRALVRTDKAWIPDSEDGALYLRPFMFASEVFLGVKPAAEYLYIVMASSVGAYFKGAPSVSLWVTREYTRAAPGGTGAAKCGGNYATSLIAQAEAIRHGCDQVVFLDAVERRWVEELGGMNIFFVFDDGSMVTPPLTGTILPGITRDSILRLAADQGITVREAPYSIEQWQADATSGRLTEAFACGTAAVVTPIGSVRGAEGGFTIGGQSIGPLTQRIRESLVAIQRGTAPDPYGWVEEIA
ncbi:branched-chain amino acid aminotransferase [Sphingosinicella sp. LHD-64]|uniref:branched-chain amino acid aminotransferase n=1 Tax=Sphingosinicella sp. LHD-64 TaxID=3072139 RepID=UPI00280CE296|nr:branched-chain amino acid aminotransferase [Sphingosinicella sp. LHD-64]MDQ8757535.1 branched-chain amino acid aminotransferase [Sphingosinicella sp. LHD-64]